MTTPLLVTLAYCVGMLVGIVIAALGRAAQ